MGVEFIIQARKNEDPNLGSTIIAASVIGTLSQDFRRTVNPYDESNGPLIPAVEPVNESSFNGYNSSGKYAGFSQTGRYIDMKA